MSFDTLAGAVKHVESGGSDSAVSPKGAVGSMQTMPFTLTDPGFGVTPAKDQSPAERERVGRDYAKMIEGAVTNIAPFSGTVRQVQDTLHGSAPESVTWIDKMLRAVPGLGLGLPARIDALGDPVGGRVMGVDASITGDGMDPVKAQLADLGVNISQLQKADPTGFKLTSEELSELRRIRGHEATNRDGLTMREALQDLFSDPAFKGLRTRDQKHDAVAEVMRGFNESARSIFEERNADYLADRTANKALADYMAEGLTPAAARSAATADTVADGLPAPTRLP